MRQRRLFISVCLCSLLISGLVFGQSSVPARVENAMDLSRLTAGFVAPDSELTEVLVPGLSVATLGPRIAETAGEEVPVLVIPELEDAAGIARDVDGISHIVAGNAHDLFFLQGWVHARDRLFQMDLTRRQVSGTLAELFGPSQLGSDVVLRTIGLRRAAERSLLALTEETVDALEAYAAGVNAFVERNGLPMEYALIEISTFEPWRPVDSVLISKAIAFSLSFDLDIASTERLLTYLAAGEALGFDGQALYFEDLFRSAPFDPFATVPAGMGTEAAATVPPTSAPFADEANDRTPAIDPSVIELGRDYLEKVADIPLFDGARDPREIIKGSNEWVISPEKSESGEALFANDAHLRLGTPSTFYQVHLAAPAAGYDVIGSGFAGSPFIVHGQNRYLTWGSTNNAIDVTDTFQEQVVPDADSPSGLSTVYGETLEALIPVPQVFRYNRIGDGEPDNLETAPPDGFVGETYIPAVVLISPRRNNGPIIALDLETGFALSVQYTGFAATREMDFFRLVNLARNLDDFRRALDFFDFGSQNWAYAGVDGHIAYFTSAEMPIREDLQQGRINGLPPWFIRNGLGGNEWIRATSDDPRRANPYEILPVDEMPHLIDPPAGFFINANNDPAGITLDNQPLNQLRPGGGIFYLGYGFADGQRAQRIWDALHERMGEDGLLNAEDMKAVQAETTMRDAQVFTPVILGAYERATADSAHPMMADLAADPRVSEAVERLANWNHATATGVFEGFDAADENGERSEPDAAEIDASVATTIYSVWRARIIRNTIDVPMDLAGLPKPGSSQSVSALRNLFDSFETRQGVGASGVNFFDLPDVEDAGDRRDIIVLRSLAEALDLLAGEAFEDAFKASTNQDDYVWGRLHRLILRHPLGGPFNVPPAGGAFPPSFDDLDGFAVDGGLEAPDAARHSARASSSHAFIFTNGPVRRYVGEVASDPGSIEAQTSLPGGTSGNIASPFYANLLARWLTNDTYPVRQTPTAIYNALFDGMLFVPSEDYDPPVRPVGRTEVVGTTSGQDRQVNVGRRDASTLSEGRTVKKPVPPVSERNTTPLPRR